MVRAWDSWGRRGLEDAQMTSSAEYKHLESGQNKPERVSLLSAVESLGEKKEPGR